jgi:enamine deaminase RidA (YjgF/YER057c/UK114 family)
MSEFVKENHNYNAGWAKDLFSDVAVVSGTPRFIFLSGVSSEDLEATDLMTMRIQGADFAEQCRIVFHKIKKLLAAEGAMMNDIVRMTAYVTDAANLWTYFQIQGEELDGASRPPHTFLQVAGLALPQMQVGIEVTAVVAP